MVERVAAFNGSSAENGWRALKHSLTHRKATLQVKPPGYARLTQDEKSVFRTKHHSSSIGSAWWMQEIATYEEGAAFGVKRPRLAPEEASLKHAEVSMLLRFFEFWHLHLG